MKTSRILCTIAAATFVSYALAESGNDIKDNEFNPVQTGVTTLSITPDARGSAMGNLGAATDADINAQFWNPSKYAFAYSAGGVGISYTPWLRKIVNDIFLADVSGYLKLGSSDNQAISASLRYFSLGEVIVDESIGTNTINPYEFALDFGYSRKLSEKFSMGVVLRYILSDLSYEDSYSGETNTAGSAFAVDLSGYYTTFPLIGRSECQWSWGFNVSNIGSKVSYDHGTNYYYLPTNLRLGTNFTFPLADYNLLSIGLDLNKLLVPTKPRENDYINPGGAYYDPDKDEAQNAAAFDDALQKWETMSPITGIFKSFSDAPGGFSEELKEINVSLGAEYSYNDQFFVRMGYNYENAMKGGRSYFGFGAGFSLNVVRLDASYMLATAQSSPLDQTMRFTLSFDMDGIRDLLGKRRR
ncbi:MAG: type IX secretion system outer membrane channel protein PorV [Muribaculaceae bacterium]|nr:type IX secretion system outer membrane channel protein PorV [Muribaculaceae bacterium]